MDDTTPPAPQQPAYQPPPPFAAPADRAAPVPAYQPYQPYGPYQPYQPGFYPAAGPPGYPSIEPGRPARNRALIVVALVAVLALGGLGIYWWASSNGSPRRIAVPANFDGYERLTGPTAQRVESTMRSLGDSMAGGGVADVFNAAAIGVYGHRSGDLPVLIVIALRTPAVPASLGATTPDDVAQAMLKGGTSDSSPFPPGPHGGASRCGTTQFGAVAETMCSWSDATTTGMLVSVREGLRPSALSQVELRLRDQIG